MFNRGFPILSLFTVLNDGVMAAQQVEEHKRCDMWLSHFFLNQVPYIFNLNNPGGGRRRILTARHTNKPTIMAQALHFCTHKGRNIKYGSAWLTSPPQRECDNQP